MSYTDKLKQIENLGKIKVRKHGRTNEYTANLGKSSVIINSPEKPKTIKFPKHQRKCEVSSRILETPRGAYFESRAQEPQLTLSAKLIN